MRTDFTHAVDRFLAGAKTVTGTPKWAQARTPPDQAWSWLLIVDGTPSEHRLTVEARLGDDTRRFCVLVSFVWLGRAIPVLRLTLDPEEHCHHNRFDRPPHLPALVRGPRCYRWPDNRANFTPGMLGLPYATPLERKHHTLDNAIRFVAGEGNISLANVILPAYPSREGLFG